VPDDVSLGWHLCYGDVEEHHFVQPADAQHLADVVTGIARSVTRPVDWVHLPVPIERDDAAYFAPLAEAEWPEGATVFLGLVHHEDGVDGALRRAAAARDAVPRFAAEGFGIATECGFGRGPAERTVPLLHLHAEVAAQLG
jgi:methionine synthase II (cobalamin-independent)